MESYSLKDDLGRELLSLQNHYLQYPYEAEPHTHSFLEISCVKSGYSEYEVDGRHYDIQPYDVFVLNNIEPHCIRIRPGDRLVNMVIHFEPGFIWNNLAGGIDYHFLRIFFERTRSFENRLDRSNPSTKRIYDLMIEIEQEFINRRPAYELMIKIKLQSIFVEIIRGYDYVAETRGENAMASKDAEAMNRVFAYIERHLSDDIKLEDLASEAIMSPSYFSTSFKKCNGVSPFEYIARVRVKRSIEYIRSTGKSMTEIATLCGFNNSTSFIKSFKKVTGKTPSFYRSTGSSEHEKHTDL